MRTPQEQLTAYIDAILNHPETTPPEPTGLQGPDRALAERLQLLGRWVTEANRYAAALAQGEPAAEELLSPGNVFAANLRAIRGSVQHMTGQIEEIVTQNYTQAMKDAPARSFDAMVKELQHRTAALENERNLFVQFTESASERIIVLDEITGEMVFANKVAREFHDQTIEYIDDAGTVNGKSGCSATNPYSEWMHTVIHPAVEGQPQVEYYQVHSLYIIWEHRGAIAHMFSNVTEQQALEELAMKDALTGAFSRAYAMRYLDRLYDGGSPFAIAFVDVDYLKYCNDTFGHAAGDAYLMQVVALLGQAAPDAVVCRTGGDEFMAISQQTAGPALKAKMEELRAALGAECFAGSDIHKSFSYGIAARTAATTDDLQRLLADADERMYQNKLENKKTNHLALHDDRLV